MEWAATSGDELLEGDRRQQRVLEVRGDDRKSVGQCNAGRLTSPLLVDLSPKRRRCNASRCVAIVGWSARCSKEKRRQIQRRLPRLHQLKAVFVERSAEWI